MTTCLNYENKQGSLTCIGDAAFSKLLLPP